MNDFDQLITDIERETRDEGPEAVAELQMFDSRFRLAAQLLAARRQARMTQKELALRSGVQQADISRIERGEVTPRVSTLDRLLMPLGRHLAVVEDRATPAA
jgi:ribosome-binding protein aMBF1 (putative translation factor)